METIWSYIIWDKLKKRDVKIHKTSMKDLKGLIDEYREKVGEEEFESSIITDLSPLDEVEYNVDWYDGPFHEIVQNKTKEKDKLFLHDTMLLPMLYHICKRLQVSKSEIDLLKTLLEDRENNYKKRILIEKNEKKS